MNLTALRNTGHTRQISHRNSGSSHGPIVRLMCPSDFGQLLKPFVFLDLFDAPSSFLGQMDHDFPARHAVQLDGLHGCGRRDDLDLGER
ncbi:hypothetical protein PS941_01433 [Pseudomonas fluorescens]|uniref:Uncharacterized protein n=1 Tax=Pseudomonas fluorescens TaxID=294 RepID=A0A5E7SNF9_PSEFL|nr:hypothetical protein PS941_01433 [Pseudomonas fluorescens]